MSGTRSASKTAPATEPAILVAAHGGTGGEGNPALLAVTDRLARRFPSLTVDCGVLNGAPSLAEVAARLRDRPLLVHPFFMADGYYVARVLPRLLAEAGCGEVTILEALGRLPGLADLAAAAAPPLRGGRIMAVGHGSKQSARSRLSTELFAARVATRLALPGGIACCFLDEPPFAEDAVRGLAAGDVLLAFFADAGRHGLDDISAILEAADRRAVRVVGPMGGLKGIASLIADQVCKALEQRRLHRAEPLAHYGLPT